MPSSLGAPAGQWQGSEQVYLQASGLCSTQCLALRARFWLQLRFLIP